MDRRLVIIVSAALTLASCARELEPAQAEISPVTEESSVIKGEMIVQLSSEANAAVAGDLAQGRFLQTRSSGLNGIFSSLEVTSVERLFPFDEEWEERHIAYGLDRWYTVKYRGEIPHTRAASELEMSEDIEFVEIPRKIHSTAAPLNDPMLTQQWHYYNDGSLGTSYVEGCDINVVPVWENYTAGVPQIKSGSKSYDVIVGVVDGGIDLAHEDLAAVCIPGGSSGSRNFVDNSYQIVAHDHGTHVGGTIGAINNNGKGVAGIAGGLDGKGGVKLLSCQIFRTDPATGKDVGGNSASAIVWAADHGAVICQNSWGYDYETLSDAQNGSVGSVGTAIQYFIDNAGKDKSGNQTGPMAGGVVIFSAGNEGWPIGWPAADERVIAVGATNGAFRRSSYSNYGDWVDICAPGGDVQSGHLIVSTMPGNGYGKMQGTSMACPHVSGVAALLVSYYGGPGFTNEMLKERLLGGARKGVIPSNAQIGPLLDALGSFNYGDSNPPSAVETFTIDAISNNIHIKAVVPADAESRQASGIMVLASKNDTDLNNPDPKNLPSSVISSDISCKGLKAGDSVEGLIKGLEFKTSYYIRTIAYDYNRNYSAASPMKSVSTLDNNPPVISYDGGRLSVKAHESTFVTISISEPDMHSYNVSFTPGSDAAELVKLSQEGAYQLIVTGNKAEAGVYQAVITATDSYNSATSLKVDYEIQENHAPEIIKLIDNMIFENAGMKMAINMDEYLHDPDGERLSYSISISDKSVIHINPKENVLNLTTLDYGLVEVTITATDARGLQCELKFKVLIREESSEASIYPNPVVKDAGGNSILNICGGVTAETEVKIVSSSGKIIFEGKGESNAFEPYKVNMNICAAGKYRVTATIDGHSTTKDIVKL